MSTARTAVVDQTAGRGVSTGYAGLLLAGAVLVGVGGLVGVVTGFDHSSLGAVAGAGWIVLLPAVVAVAFTALKPAIGLAVTAGAGVVALSRSLADLGLLNSPNNVVRPEFFYELTDRAQPFSSAPGAVVVVLGDGLMVVAGLLAARRLATSLSFRTDRIFDDVEEPGLADAPTGPELLVEAREQDEAVRSEDADGAAPTGPRRNNWLVFAGFVGVLMVLAASLGFPYSGGYLAARYIPPELGLSGLGAALAGALVATIAVLAAAILPRAIAVGLLGGVALGAAVPFLTAMLVSITDAPVQLNPVVGLGILGVIVIAAAGGLARVSFVQDDYSDPSRASVLSLNVVGAVLSLVVAVAAVTAWRVAQLRYSGGVVPTTAGSGVALSAPQSAPFLVAAFVPAIGGVLWLVPPLARVGRALAAVSWVALAYAVAQSTYVLGQLVASASYYVPGSPFSTPSWSAGPGLWWGVVGIGSGLAVLAVATVSGRQAAQASSLVVDDDTVAPARTVGTMVAVGLSIITLVVLSLPVYDTSQLSSATLLDGYQANSWGVLTLAAGMIGAAWAAGRSQWVSGAVAFALSGAAVMAVRLVIPAAVRAQDGFSTRPGLVAGYVAVFAFAIGAVLLAVSSSRIRRAELVPLVPAAPAMKPVREPGVAARSGGGRTAVRDKSEPDGSGGRRSGASSREAKKGRR